MRELDRASIVLGDGQAWSIAKPVHDEDGDYHAVLEKLFKADDDLMDQLDLIANLAVGLIRRGREVTDDELARLLPLAKDAASGEWEPTNRKMWQRLFEIVSGQSGEDGSTRHRWLRLAGIRAGIHRGAVLLEDLNDIAQIMVADEAFPPAFRWVGWMNERACQENNASTLDSLI